VPTAHRSNSKSRFYKDVAPLELSSLYNLHLIKSKSTTSIYHH